MLRESGLHIFDSQVKRKNVLINVNWDRYLLHSINCKNL